MIIEDSIYKFSSFPLTVIQGISTRYYGLIKDSTGFYKDNLNKFADALGIESESIIFPYQKHTGNVLVVQPHPSPPLTPIKSGLRGEGIDGVDGFITKERGLLLGIVTADCLPILFYDPKKKIVGIVHAGYRGLLNRILENMIIKFANLGSDIKDILVGIGPGIGVCCYSIPPERVARFFELYPECKDVYQKKKDKFFLDLISIAEYILMTKGIIQAKIEKASICTKDNIDKFYSYRGDSTETFGQFASVIGLN